MVRLAREQASRIGALPARTRKLAVHLDVFSNPAAPVARMTHIAERTLVTLATYNEIENLPRLVEEIFAVVPQVDILVIDDNSPDGTGRWCDERARGEPATALPASRPASWAWAPPRSPACGTRSNTAIDTCSTWTPISAIIRAICRRCWRAWSTPAAPAVDVMIGSRYIAGGAIEGWPLKRHLMSRGVNTYARWLLGTCDREIAAERFAVTARRTLGASRLRRDPLARLFVSGRDPVAIEATGMQVRRNAHHICRPRARRFEDRFARGPSCAADHPVSGRTPLVGRKAIARLGHRADRSATMQKRSSLETADMTVLVTGGAGFIGSHFIERLLAQQPDARIVCLDNFNDYYDPAIKRANAALFANDPRVELVEQSFVDTAAMQRLFVDKHVRRVVHLGAIAGVRASVANPLIYEETNVRGTLALLEAARRSSGRTISAGIIIDGLRRRALAAVLRGRAAGRSAQPVRCLETGRRNPRPDLSPIASGSCRLLATFQRVRPRVRPDLAMWIFAEAIEQGRSVPLFGDGRFGAISRTSVIFATGS